MIAPSEAEKENLVAFLNQNKIATRPFFWCMDEQPVFKEMGLFQNESYPNAEKLARNGLYLPSGLGIDQVDLERVVGVVKKHKLGEH